MLPPVITRSLAYRIQRCLDAHHRAGIAGAHKQPGNPYGIEIQQFGAATAFLSCVIPDVEWYNRILGLEADDVARFDEILAFFRKRRIRCVLETDPGTFSDRLGQALTGRGLSPIRHDTVVYGLPEALLPPPPPEVHVEAIDANDIDLFLEIWANGFGFDEDTYRRGVQEIRKSWSSIPEEYLYVAFVDREPAAIAGLYIDDQIGYLHVGATVPEFRKRGCHTALIHQRIADAAAAGCELIIGQASFGSASQHNLERAGLQIAYTKLVWMDRAE